LPEQDLVEESERKYLELQSAKAVFVEEHEKVVRELKELQDRHQEELKKKSKSGILLNSRSSRTPSASS